MTHDDDTPVIDAWGIARGFHDVHGDWVEAPQATIDALREQMGAPVAGEPLWFVPEGSAPDLLGACRLILEDGVASDADHGIVTRLPDDVPIGYHRLVPTDGGPTTTLVVHPRRCPAPPRAWGVAAQVYALWSHDSWGIGDLRDVARLAARVHRAGGSVMQLSPLHTAAPSTPQEASPYYPSSRRAFSPLLIPITDADPPLDLVVDHTALIDRDRVWAAKRTVLERRFRDERWDPAWRHWASTADTSLWTVARWNTIADDHGGDWSTWPASLRRVEDPTFDRRAADDPAVMERLEFHAWCQWLVRRHLEEAASQGVGLVADLAVGFSPGGADAWAFQDLLALGARIGAPPDVFNAAGQDWGLPPFVPWRLRAAHYRPLIQTLRACLTGMSGIRIDHVMGLMRQYWVPVGGSPRAGAYVHLPLDEMLAIVALETTRAGAFVVGEDLGTVAPEMREAMARWGVLGTRVVLFEDTAPDAYPEMSLATATTHDLPTLAALWNGLGDQRLAQPVHELADPAPDTVTAIAHVHDALLASPARLRLLTTDDLCGAIEQPNRPGTVQPSNWSRPLPVAVADIALPHA